MAPVRDNDSARPKGAAVPAGADREASRVAAELDRIVGDSSAIRDVKEQMQAFARSEAPLLLLGESGTGKTFVAAIIHRLSQRHGKFTPVNCGTLTESLATRELFGHRKGAYTDSGAGAAGLIAEANGGTLFLDEVADLSEGVQSMFLTVIEDGEYLPLGSKVRRKSHFRLIAATRKPLEALVSAKMFRDDLFGRLRGNEITMPPLRDRGRDVVLLAEHLLRKRWPENPPQLLPGASELLIGLDWPYNIRGLDHVLNYATAFSDNGTIDADLMAKAIAKRRGPRASSGGSIAQLVTLEAHDFRSRRAYIQRVADATGGNRRDMARILGISPRTLRRYCAELGVLKSRETDGRSSTPSGS